MITLVTTIGKLPPERQAPVIEALKRNISLSQIGEIVIVTEDSLDWLLGRGIIDSVKLTTVQVSTRPTFAQMIEVANDRLKSAATTVALTNADISFASDADTASVLEVSDSLSTQRHPVVLALTRHELKESGPSLSLYSSSGLPNTISADMWVFNSPLTFGRELFYSLGQMNCDMLFAHDLISSGYRLVNPCLDVTILHHEDEKDEEFYQTQNEKSQSLEMLYRHVRENKIEPWNYFGVPWVRTEWLKRGYRPNPNSTNGRRMIVGLEKAAEHRLDAVLHQIKHLLTQFNLEIQIVCDGEIDRFILEHSELLIAEPRIWFCNPQESVAATRHAFLKGNQYGFERIAFIDNVTRLDAALAAAADCFFVSLHSTASLPPPADLGCTLVTSVFRSDSFLKGFLNNCSGLLGYGTMIEHVFLVSELSDLESELFNHLLSAQDNTVVVWHRKDPGLYECWNIGIRIARTNYISNANVDDLRDPRHVVTLVKELACHPTAVVAATALVPFYEYPADGAVPPANPIWYADQAGPFEYTDLARPLTKQAPRLEPHNIPHCMPVWRRSLHTRYGWFDESRHGTYADWAFWLKALRDGNYGRLNALPLSFYFVNPTSHNRRGDDLERYHNAVESEFLPSFVALAEGAPPPRQVLPGSTPRKLHLYGRELEFGQHRNSFSELITSLTPLDAGSGGIRFVPFLERQFVWGGVSYAGEAASSDPRPLTEPWTGILHVPFEAPNWFDHGVSPEVFMESELFRASLPACRGIITLCSDLERDLNHYLPGLPTFSLPHPTDMKVNLFDPQAYRAAPCIVQVGDWLRKLQAIHKLKAPGHRRIMLLKTWTKAFLEREIAQFGNAVDPDVLMPEFIPNDEYDALISSSVVICLLYATAANNVVIECLARATPLIINPLPAVIEYLGVDYPFYARDEAEADELLLTPGLVEHTHHYLKRRRTQIDLTYEKFRYTLGSSEFYRAM